MKNNKIDNSKGMTQKTSGSSRSSLVEMLRPDPAGVKKPASSSQAGSGSIANVVPLRPGPTHEQIAERAKAIWIQRGRIPGQDQANWYEAESQLKAEMQRK